ncbi:1-deoxy-D-xylulose-5-phosphate synthase [subsurface metagenome]
MALPSWFKKDRNGRLKIEAKADQIYALGHLIRITEESLLDLFSQNLLSGTTHTCIGQEICQIGVVRALNHPKDFILSNHRNHGHFLTYCGKVGELIAEVMGKQMGICQGRGGSQHLAFERFMSNGIQGGMTGIGAGLGLAKKLREEGGIVAVFVGDGTTGQGLFYESLNMTSVWEVPVLFVVEDNKIAQTTHTKYTIGGAIQERGRAFGLSTWLLRDREPQFLKKAENIVSVIRSTRKPGFLVIETVRLGPHSKGDDTRTKEEMKEIWSDDPLRIYKEQVPVALREQIEKENQAFVEAAIEKAKRGPNSFFEKETPKHIFVLPRERSVRSKAVQHESVKVRVALNSALKTLLQTNPDVLLLGEDLQDPYGGAFKVTKGLSTEFPERVISTPISEAGITGAAIGLAMAGYKPIVEIMFADFLTLCMDQIYNHAVKFPGIFPEVKVPLVIRAPSGGHRGYGPTHSQSPENIFVSIPGLTVIFGSHRHQVGELLVRATLDWPYPVLFLEHKLLYTQDQEFLDYEILPASDKDIAADLFPTLIRRRRTPDLAILTYGGCLQIVEEVVEVLENEEEINVETLVPALLSPFPTESVVKRLMTTLKIVIIEETQQPFGVGAEIAANLVEKGYLGQIIRIGSPPVPIPSARSLEQVILPRPESIINKIRQMFQS